MQYVEQTYTEIKIQLGILPFYLLTLTILESMNATDCQ